MIIREETSRDEHLLNAARQMMSAARTAPKAHGKDNLGIAVATGDTIKQLARTLNELAPVMNRMFFHRDAENILSAGAVVLIGTGIHPLGMDCGLCGFATCEVKEEHPAAPCFFNSHDLGLAVGSAVSKAADCRVDSRVMYSAGVAAKEMNLLPGCATIIAIPISATGKSPFFDRKSTRK